MAVGTEALANNAMWLVTIIEKVNTAIEDVLMENNGVEDEIYDLQGRKVTTPKRGVYIKNGKKVIY